MPVENIRAMLAGEYGPAPSTSPFPEFIPEGRKAHIVPHEHRALLTRIAHARRELNKYKPSQPRYAHQQVVETKALELDTLLKERAGVSGAIAVEYHAEWLYSVLTHEDVFREHEEFERKLKAEKSAP